MRFSSIAAVAATAFLSTSAMPATGVSAAAAAGAAAAGPVNAVPVRVMMVMAGQIDYVWKVSDWQIDCESQACAYSFDVAADPYESYPEAPAFSARCSGAGEGASYAPCQILDDAAAAKRFNARLLAKDNGTAGAHVQLSYQYAYEKQAGTYFNWTGDAFAPQQSSSFDLVPSEVFGIA